MVSTRKLLPSLLTFAFLALLEVPSSSFQPVATNLAGSPRLRLPNRPPHCLVREQHSEHLSLTTRPLFAESSSDTNYEPSTTKEEMETGYKRGKFIFGAAAAIVLAIPDRTLSKMLASKMGGVAGLALASGLCHILEGANKHDRLSSDTYKRLNVGLLGFSVLGLAAVPGEAGFLPTAGPAMGLSAVLFLIRMYGARVAWKGWERGVNPRSSGTNVLTELVDGTKATFVGLKIQNRKKGLSYANLLLLVVFGMVSNFMEGIFNIRYLQTFHKSLFDISLKWSAVSRLFMISTMIFSLKDAAERDRLTGTTFIQMNVMVGLWAVVVGLALSASTATTRGGVEMFAFSLPFFIKALKSQKEKQEEKKKKDIEGSS